MTTRINAQNQQKENTELKSMSSAIKRFSSKFDGDAGMLSTELQQLYEKTGNPEIVISAIKMLEKVDTKRLWSHKILFDVNTTIDHMTKNGGLGALEQIVMQSAFDVTKGFKNPRNADAFLTDLSIIAISLDRRNQPRELMCEIIATVTDITSNYLRDGKEDAAISTVNILVSANSVYKDTDKLKALMEHSRRHANPIQKLHRKG